MKKQITQKQFRVRVQVRAGTATDPFAKCQSLAGTNKCACEYDVRREQKMSWWENEAEFAECNRPFAIYMYPR